MRKWKTRDWKKVAEKEWRPVAQGRVESPEAEYGKRIKLLERIDTRQWVEEGDRWVPLGGTGEANQCDFCGKDHEVHYHVTDGEKTYIVGSSCAKKMGVPEKELNKLDRTFKKKKEIEYYSELHNLYTQIKSDVQSGLKIDIEIYDVSEGHFSIRDKNTGIGGIWVHTTSEDYKREGGIPQERKQCLQEKVLRDLVHKRFGELTNGKDAWRYEKSVQSKFNLTDDELAEYVMPKVVESPEAPYGKQTAVTLEELKLMGGDDVLMLAAEYPNPSQWKNRDALEWVQYWMAMNQGKTYAQTGSKRAFKKENVAASPFISPEQMQQQQGGHSKTKMVIKRRSKKHQW